MVAFPFNFGYFSALIIIFVAVLAPHYCRWMPRSSTNLSNDVMSGQTSPITLSVKNSLVVQQSNDNDNAVRSNRTHI